ncbi:hypothetical protein F511_10700 [Dorcoceras hygrometricum]|uniref:Uncharacterized protein n=1 Tax=Dorcoceras hygrometricum TaxID=472368 RepID=A0A2Z7CTF7_9LAMI|nr:hypothetical protein F511_10700 [Dorcoceras hygrometricum]
MIEVALDSSWKALSSHTQFGGYRELEQKHEATVCACIFVGSGHTVGRGGNPAGGAPGGG